MKTVILTWKSSTQKGFWFGAKVENNGFYEKFVVEVTEEIFDTLPEIGAEIEVPAAALS